MKVSAAMAAVAVAAAGVGMVVYTYPRPVSVTIKGLQYQLGTKGHVKSVTVRVHGVLRRSLTGIRIFRGTIDIQGATVSNPDNSAL
jgi:hypothetical protein